MTELLIGQQTEESRPSYEYAENLHLSYLDVFAKQIAYRQRFRNIDFTESRDGYLLPLDICEQELRRAETQLIDEGKSVSSATMVSVGARENAGFEIGVNGRRFSVPRDQFTPHPYRDLVNIETAVVTVLDQTKWPINQRYEITPRISDVLQNIATGSLIDEVRDLAVYLQLGDKMPFNKRNLLKKEVFARALDQFGVEDIEEVRKILKSIGLKIVDTSERYSKVVGVDADSNDPNSDPYRIDLLKTLGLKTMLISTRDSGQKYGMNARTEVDALLEAIHKTV